MSDMRYHAEVRLPQASLEWVAEAAAEQGLSAGEWVLDAVHDAAAADAEQRLRQLPIDIDGPATLDVELGDEAVQSVRDAARAAGVSVNQWISKTVQAEAAAAKHAGARPDRAKTAFRSELDAAIATARQEARQVEEAIFNRRLGEVVAAATPELAELEWRLPHRWVALGIHGHVNKELPLAERYRIVWEWAALFGTGTVEVIYKDQIKVVAHIAIHGQAARVFASVWTPEAAEPAPTLRDVRVAANPDATAPTVTSLVEQYRHCYRSTTERDYHAPELRQLENEINDRLKELPAAEQDQWRQFVADNPAPRE